MTIETITKQLDRISADSYYEVKGNDIAVLIINDFEGFDEEMNPVFRELIDEDTVEKVLEWLEENADDVEHELYHYYYSGDNTVLVGFTSSEV